MQLLDRLVITRLVDNGKQTLGRAVFYKGLDKLFEFVTLELAWKDNQKNISCIPAGEYAVIKRHSPQHNEHFHITNVKDRSYVLFHVGNFVSDTQGCVLIGKDFADINKDGLLDVTSSKATLERLLTLAPMGFLLDIVRAP